MSKAAANLVHERTLAHEVDAGWIMALWLAIHGGDPAPNVIAGQIISAVAPYLTNATRSITLEQLQTKLKKIGMDVTSSKLTGDDELTVPTPPPPRQYCFLYNGERICIASPPRPPVEQ
jgi:hypothetical protein